MQVCVCHILKFTGIDYDEALFACVVHTTTHDMAPFQLFDSHITRLCESNTWS